MAGSCIYIKRPTTDQRPTRTDPPRPDSRPSWVSRVTRDPDSEKKTDRPTDRPIIYGTVFWGSFGPWETDDRRDRPSPFFVGLFFSWLWDVPKINNVKKHEKIQVIFLFKFATWKCHFLNFFCSAKGGVLWRLMLSFCFLKRVCFQKALKGSFLLKGGRLIPALAIRQAGTSSQRGPKRAPSDSSFGHPASWNILPNKPTSHLT